MLLSAGWHNTAVPVVGTSKEDNEECKKDGRRDQRGKIGFVGPTKVVNFPEV